MRLILLFYLFAQKSRQKYEILYDKCDKSDVTQTKMMEINEKGVKIYTKICNSITKNLLN